MSSYGDSQVSYFAEGTAPSGDYAIKNGLWLDDLHLIWGMLGWQECPPPHAFRTHVQLHNPNTSSGGQLPQIVSHRPVHPTTPLLCAARLTEGTGKIRRKPSIGHKGSSQCCPGHVTWKGLWHFWAPFFPRKI